MDFRDQLISLLVQATGLSDEEVRNRLAVPPDQKLGDYAFPCFRLNPAYGNTPLEAATMLSQELKLPRFITKVEAAGPYLNFFLDYAAVAEETLLFIRKEKGRYGREKNNRTLVIEYCGPNTNKPLHLGHLRNMAIGSALCRTLAFAGNRVHPVNIVNDRGIHICQSMLAYHTWGKGKTPSIKGDHFVGDWYVRFAKEAAAHEGLKKEAQELLLKWERNDRQVRALWKTMTTWVLKGFQETYKRFGVSFEKEYFESSYYQQGKEIVAEGLKKKIFEKDHTGAVTAPLEKYKIPDKILLRGDETSLYITQDLYLAGLRYRDFKFDQMIYVVASEQQLHFQQLFKILALLQRPYAEDMRHLSYGLVHLPSGRMKSREGTVVDADDIMDEMSALAEKEVRKRHKNLSATEIRRRAESIGLAAIKFFMLRTDALRDMVFNPEESLQFEGETGPYVQYTHARACSILRKAGKLPSTADFSLLRTAEEKRLVSLLTQFPEIVHEAAATYRLHILCRYLLDLSQLFNEFYHSSPVISGDKPLMNARLLLLNAVRQVLENGLTLLSIDALEEM